MTATPPALPQRYSDLKVIAAGGFAEAILAKDTKFDRPVVIKVLLAKHAGDDEIRARFVSEAQNIRSVEGAGVPTVYDIEEDAERPFYVMEFCDRGTLAERLRQSMGPVSLEEAAGLAEAITVPVDKIHGAGLVHRDLKPANLMFRSRKGGGDGPAIGNLIAPDEELVAIDLGLAGRIDGRLLTRLTRPGWTDGFASPSQRQGIPPSPRFDIFAASTILIQAFCGHPPSTEPGPNGMHFTCEDMKPTGPLQPVLERGLGQGELPPYDDIVSWRDDIRATVDDEAREVAQQLTALEERKGGRNWLGVVFAIGLFAGITFWLWPDDTSTQLESLKPLTPTIVDDSGGTDSPDGTDGTSEPDGTDSPDGPVSTAVTTNTTTIPTTTTAIPTTTTAIPTTTTTIPTTTTTIPTTTTTIPTTTTTIPTPPPTPPPTTGRLDANDLAALDFTDPDACAAIRRRGVSPGDLIDTPQPAGSDYANRSRNIVVGPLDSSVNVSIGDNDVFCGGNLNDTVGVKSGAPIVQAGAGDDTFVITGGSPTVYGGVGNDETRLGAEAKGGTFHGGPGLNRAKYNEYFRGPIETVFSGKAATTTLPDGSRQELFDVEYVMGTRFDDRLDGSGAAFRVQLFGFDGVDTLVGSPHTADNLHLGPGGGQADGGGGSDLFYVYAGGHNEIDGGEGWFNDQVDFRNTAGIAATSTSTAEQAITVSVADGTTATLRNVGAIGLTHNVDPNCSVSSGDLTIKCS